MNIGIQTFGSEGDVRPLIALAQGVRQRGHTVRVVVSSIDNKDYGECAISLFHILACIQ
jgi:sterol 3beta-glucosyltransferase